jgi:hypothetical protein
MTIFDPPGLTLEREKRAEPRKKATTKILLRSSQRALTMMGNGWTTEAIEHTHQSTISLSACIMRGDKDFFPTLFALLATSRVVGSRVVGSPNRLRVCCDVFCVSIALVGQIINNLAY